MSTEVARTARPGCRHRVGRTAGSATAVVGAVQVMSWAGAAGLVAATGPELLRADVYATAAMVLGAAEAHRWITSKPGYALLTVAGDDEARASTDFAFAPSG
ncbi:hypothetical protein [Streptomyces sp. NPDC008122]|uniref:hypothetical protein n=1 Tax=Streptomyces sp. NPDC008122 TaxID=3364810 RepID=UPI0036E5D5A7